MNTRRRAPAPAASTIHTANSFRLIREGEELEPFHPVADGVSTVEQGSAADRCCVAHG